MFMANNMSDTTTKDSWDAEILGRATLNDFRNRYQSKVSAKRLIEIIGLIRPVIKDLPEAERISGLVGAIMFELL
jgi:hypothetical protein